MLSDECIELRVIESFDVGLRVAKKVFYKKNIGGISQMVSPTGHPYKTVCGLTHDVLGSVFVFMEYDKLKKELYYAKRRIGF